MPASISLECPECGAKFKPTEPGPMAECPRCGQSCSVGAPTGSDPALKAAGARKKSNPGSGANVVIRREFRSGENWTQSAWFNSLKANPLVVIGAVLLVAAVVIGYAVSSTSNSGESDGNLASSSTFDGGSAPRVAARPERPSGAGVGTVPHTPRAAPAPSDHSKTPPAPAVNAQPAAAEVVKIGAADLMQAFIDDTSKAAGRYRLSRLEVTGTVSQVTNKGYSREVTLRGPAGSKGILCNGFRDGDLVDRVATVETTVTIRGTFLGIGNRDFVMLVQCELVEPKTK